METAEMPSFVSNPESLDGPLLETLETVYGTRLKQVLDSLRSMGDRYYFRLNRLASKPDAVVAEMRGSGLDIRRHETIHDAAYIPTRENTLEPKGMPVVANRFAAEAVLQGAHLYAPGVKHCHGLRPGRDASVVDETGYVAGLGTSRQSETSILTYRTGVAVEVQQNMFGLPSLRETTWYRNGQIYMQSLPALATCLVLDPQPGEFIVDLNCAPGGKLSFICQLTSNQAEIVGFDRKTKKLDHTRRQLERLGCENYRLIPHDSRYVHLDYSFKADRVLVDPPCTGLGVTPKLSLTTTGRDVKNLSNYQKQFLHAASEVVKPKGTIVYSVCTITYEECEEVVRYGVEDLGMRLEEAIPMVGRPGLDPEGLTQRFDPDNHGVGYFIARFRKQ